MFGDQSIVGLVSVDERDAAAAAHGLVELLIDPGSASRTKVLSRMTLILSAATVPVRRERGETNPRRA
jgi:hypothetical protein